jgi:hypothetical protein
MPEPDDRGHQPTGRLMPIKLPTPLTTHNHSHQPFSNRKMPLIAVRTGRRGVKQARIPLGNPHAGVQHPQQRVHRRSRIRLRRIHRGDNLLGDPVNHRGQQLLPRWVVGIHGLARHPRRRNGLKARIRPLANKLNGRIKDRRETPCTSPTPQFVTSFTKKVLSDAKPRALLRPA